MKEGKIEGKEEIKVQGTQSQESRNKPTRKKNQKITARSQQWEFSFSSILWTYPKGTIGLDHTAFPSSSPSSARKLLWTFPDIDSRGTFRIYQSWDTLSAGGAGVCHLHCQAHGENEALLAPPEAQSWLPHGSLHLPNF